MILKGVEVLPHGLINHVATKLGSKGELLLEYINWLKQRITQLKPYPDYAPVIHLDVYGTIGIAFDYNQPRILKYFADLALAQHHINSGLKDRSIWENKQGRSKCYNNQLI